MAGNTYSSDLICQHLEASATTILTDTLAPLRAFSRQFSPDEFKPRATVQCKFVTTGATTQINASDFEQGDSIVVNREIAVSQYTTAFHVTNDELNSGLRLEDLTLRNAKSFAESVLDAVMAPISSENLATIVTRNSDAFTLGDMATAWGALKKSSIKYAVLDGEYMARIINSPVFYQETGVESGSGWKLMGWDGIFLNSRWSGTHAGAGDENIRGIFCNPQVLGVVAGVPMRVPNPTLVTKIFTIPQLDLSVALNVWFSLATRTIWASYDAMIGVALLDASAGLLLKSA
jgi:hypothetical protein